MCRTAKCEFIVSEEVVWIRCIGLLVGITTNYPGLWTRYRSKFEVWTGGGECFYPQILTNVWFVDPHNVSFAVMWGRSKWGGGLKPLYRAFSWCCNKLFRCTDRWLVKIEVWRGGELWWPHFEVTVESTSVCHTRIMCRTPKCGVVVSEEVVWSHCIGLWWVSRQTIRTYGLQTVAIPRYWSKCEAWTRGWVFYPQILKIVLKPR